MIRITNDMLTGWYPADVKPVRIGVYETIGEDGAHWLSFWHGGVWGWGIRLKGVDAGAWPRVPFHRNESPTFQARTWRGITEEAVLRLSWPFPTKQV